MRIIAFYLPQFYETPENNKWWGKGFTEWDNVKKAIPQFEGHLQPKEPYNDFYYNLTESETKQWQVYLAKTYGVYGFCYYHYWFDGHLLLEKPLEQVLADPAIDLPFCICWANEAWRRTWESHSEEILMDQTYGDRDMWKAHFEYLLPFLKDPRYITNDDKPLFVIYRPNEIKRLNDMLDYWQELAIRSGLKGIDFAYQQQEFDIIPNSDTSRFKYDIEFQPVYALRAMETPQKYRSLFHLFSHSMNSFFIKKFNITLSNMILTSIKKISYDDIWKTILNSRPERKNALPGAIVNWDNSPRRGKKARVFIGSSPEKFQKYMEQLIMKAKNEYETDMIFLTAWNEWGEGCYMEPDKTNKFGYLEGLRNALVITDEFPRENV